MFDVIVIGAGPAGMMAAGRAAEKNARVLLIEKNEKLGKKLFITGKGRCNVTNSSDPAKHMKNVLTNPRFMYSAYNTMDSSLLISFFETLGVPLKTERGERVFPESDKSGDVIDGLRRYLQQGKVTVMLNTEAQGIDFKSDGFMVETKIKPQEVAPNNSIQSKLSEEGIYKCKALIIATGGLSYPSTGSTGDGYRFAKKLGHEVVKTYPALVPLKAREKWVQNLEGLSLKNVRLKSNKINFDELGEMMFTKDGITGPLVLSASAHVCDLLDEPADFSIDLKPGLSYEKLDTRLLEDFAIFQNKSFENALVKLLPARLISVIVKLSEIPPSKKVNSISKKERHKLASLIKELPLTVYSTNGFAEAVITKGGVDVKGINPKTMMSKTVNGLFFAGEVLDLIALTGGYNLQIAFSTGYLAGSSAAEYCFPEYAKAFPTQITQD